MLADGQTRGQPRRFDARCLHQARAFAVYGDEEVGERLVGRVQLGANAAAAEAQVARHDWDYLYEPDAEAVLGHVLTRYIESLVYQAVLENVASEHAARMVAMKAASDNANKLIDTLNLVYNKARQAAITQEISEIVGGAAAV